MMTDSATTPWIVLAHLLRPQGRKGELLAELLTDFPERFEGERRVFLAPPNFAGEEAEARAAQVVSFWLPVGKNEGRIVLQFAGIDSITAAEGIAGLDVIVPYEERLPLDEESEYISDLIGCTVYDGSAAVGVIDDVQFPATPDGGRRLAEAAPLLSVLSPDGDEILIPFAKAFLVGVNVKEKRVDMVLPEGLIEVNRANEQGSDQKR
ncbi:MAG TPA: ribosome maturation factor RimM [Edaphobacter sp.]|nr:ribosome maturation factor RimM [Edaphobacter sp.]